MYAVYLCDSDQVGYSGEWEPDVIESDDGINAEKTRQPTYPHYLD
jgi:hypothetical protein